MCCWPMGRLRPPPPPSSTDGGHRNSLRNALSQVAPCTHEIFDTASPFLGQIKLILQKLGTRRLLYLVGMRCTTGSILATPPSREVLINAFQALHVKGSHGSDRNSSSSNSCSSGGDNNSTSSSSSGDTSSSGDNSNSIISSTSSNSGPTSTTTDKKASGMMVRKISSSTLPPPPNTPAAAAQCAPPPEVVVRTKHIHKYSSSRLTVGARAFSKHCHRSLDKWWGECSGTEAHKNEVALRMVERILDEAVWLNAHVMVSAEVFEVRTMEGYGARWALVGSSNNSSSTSSSSSSSSSSPSFRGFLEPNSKDGHEQGWRH